MTISTTNPERTRPTIMSAPASGTTAVAPAPTLTPADFQFVAALVRDKAAIEVGPDKEYLVEQRIGSLVRQESAASISDLLGSARRDPDGPLSNLIVDAMTTNETSFFRDVHPFNALTDQILPAILAKSGPAGQINIWCGASSSGQEPYSIALAVLDKFPDLIVTRRLRIVATDLSPTMVQRTAAGKFTQLEVNRGMPARLLVKNFAQDGRDWVASRELRGVIEARTLNLIEGWIGLPRCDVVFLRNVLIYFDTTAKRQILERIRKEVLKPGGHLFLGSSETTLNIDAGYKRVEFGKSICYQAG